MPGISMAQAADIVMGETGHLPHLPQLPERGLGSDAIGRTAGLIKAVNVDRGPRSWQMTARPQLLTRRTWDRMERDLDEIAEVWGENVPLVKVQLVGPWSLAAAVELSNGHRVITDRGARNDLYEALLDAADSHRIEIKRRFNADTVLQLDEPLAADILGGRLEGTTDFDDIPAVAAEVMHGALERFEADYLNLTGQDPDWEVARSAQTVIVDWDGVQTPRHVDGLGHHLDAGRRVGLAIKPAPPRDTAIAIAQYADLLGLNRDYLVTSMDVIPRPLSATPAKDYAFAAETAGMLERDAGDL